MILEGHREADTGMIYLGVTLSRPGKNLLFRCDDTDFMMNSVHHSHRFKGRVLLDMGLTGKNNRRKIDVKQLAGAIPPIVSVIITILQHYLKSKLHNTIFCIKS